MDVEREPVVAVFGGAGGERVQQPPTDPTAAVLGRHRDDQFAHRRPVGCPDQRGVGEVPPDRTDRTAVLVERHQTHVRRSGEHPLHVGILGGRQGATLDHRGESGRRGDERGVGRIARADRHVTAVRRLTAVRHSPKVQPNE